MGVFLYCKKCKLIYLDDENRCLCDKCGKKLYSSSTEYLDAYADKGFAVVHNEKDSKRNENKRDENASSFDKMISEREAEKKRLREEQRNRREEKKKELLNKRKNVQTGVSSPEAVSTSADDSGGRPDKSFDVAAFLKGLNLE